MNETAINGKAFAGNRARLTALIDNILEQHPVNIALAEPAIAALGECRAVRHASFKP
jgi:hypothetical protein